jgi:hypothetical protein
MPERIRIETRIDMKIEYTSGKNFMPSSPAVAFATRGLQLDAG